MMPGMIMLWYGSVASIPSGWALCDGNNGTPNLINKFILAAGPVVPAPGTTGGTLMQSHAFTGDGHAHGFISGNVVDNIAPAGDIEHSTGTTAATGDTDTADNRPPFYALAYIMKLPIP